MAAASAAAASAASPKRARMHEDQGEVHLDGPNTAAVLLKKGDLRLQEIPMPASPKVLTPARGAQARWRAHGLLARRRTRSSSQ
jgi:hypothetical protein